MRVAGRRHPSTDCSVAVRGSKKLDATVSRSFRVYPYRVLATSDSTGSRSRDGAWQTSQAA